MNKQVAVALLHAELLRLRQQPYSELVQLVGKPQTTQVRGEDGNSYQFESEAFWDSGKGKNLRVMVSVDDGGLSAFKPLTDDFIMRPDGTFVGESLGGY